MRARAWSIVAIFAAFAAAVCLYPITERRYEFDGVNLRLRYRTVTRSWLVSLVYRDRSSDPVEHATAKRLRELGVLQRVAEDKSRWLLIKGFRPGVRGWIGPGRQYVRALGASSFGTPVVLPAEEDLAENLWVRWAVKQPEAATLFWCKFQHIALDTPMGDELLIEAYSFIDRSRLNVEVTDLEARFDGFVVNGELTPLRKDKARP